jgi:fructuronate reductase
MTTRLQTLEGLPASMGKLAYDRSKLTAGILHIGAGAFFRAHTAAYTEAALGAGDLSWGIEAASLRNPEVPDALNAQNGLFTLLVREPNETRAVVIGSVLRGHVAPADRSALLKRFEDPAIRIVTLTVTEKAYGIDPVGGGLDANRADIAADLANPLAPQTAVGVLVEGLARRCAAGLPPFTVLCCDNLPANGAILKRLVLDFAARRDPALSQWIGDHARFPSTMVDRITPAPTDKTRADALALTGREDHAAVETEPFSQWVIEDDFVSGRPDWHKGGAIFTSDVTAFEKMKLRMLNGAHSLIAYLGVAAGLPYVRDVMAEPALAGLVNRHLHAAASTLPPMPGIDLGQYAAQLAERFRNPAIAHRTAQIAMDGTQKLPQRLLEPAAELMAEGRAAPSFALAVAAWMRHTLCLDESGASYPINDPRGEEIAAALQNVPHTAHTIADALFALPGFFPQPLLASGKWRQEVVAALDSLLAKGAVATARRFAEV